MLHWRSLHLIMSPKSIILAQKDLVISTLNGGVNCLSSAHTLLLGTLVILGLKFLTNFSFSYILYKVFIRS